MQQLQWFSEVVGRMDNELGCDEAIKRIFSNKHKRIGAQNMEYSSRSDKGRLGNSLLL